MAPRPENHVTKALAESVRKQMADAADWPEVPLELLLYLEAIYPPRCYRSEESLEDHLMYAGAQGLVSDLRTAYDEQLRAATGEDEPEGAASVEVPLTPNGG